MSISRPAINPQISPDEKTGAKALEKYGADGLAGDLDRQNYSMKAAIFSLPFSHQAMGMQFKPGVGVPNNAPRNVVPKPSPQATSGSESPGSLAGVSGILKALYPDGLDKSKEVEGEYAKGGVIKGPGTGTSDSIPSKEPVGGAIIPEAVVKLKGKDFFDKLEAAAPQAKGVKEKVDARVSNNEYRLSPEAVAYWGVGFINELIGSDAENPAEDAVPGEEAAEAKGYNEGGIVEDNVNSGLIAPNKTELEYNAGLKRTDDLAQMSDYREDNVNSGLIAPNKTELEYNAGLKRTDDLAQMSDYREDNVNSGYARGGIIENTPLQARLNDPAIQANAIAQNDALRAKMNTPESSLGLRDRMGMAPVQSQPTVQERMPVAQANAATQNQAMRDNGFTGNLEGQVRSSPVRPAMSAMPRGLAANGVDAGTVGNAAHDLVTNYDYQHPEYKAKLGAMFPRPGYAEGGVVRGYANGVVGVGDKPEDDISSQYSNVITPQQGLGRYGLEGAPKLPTINAAEEANTLAINKAMTLAQNLQTLTGAQQDNYKLNQMAAASADQNNGLKPTASTLENIGRALGNRSAVRDAEIQARYDINRANDANVMGVIGANIEKFKQGYQGAKYVTPNTQTKGPVTSQTATNANQPNNPSKGKADDASQPVTAKLGMEPTADGLGRPRTFQDVTANRMDNEARNKWIADNAAREDAKLGQQQQGTGAIQRPVNPITDDGFINVNGIKVLPWGQTTEGNIQKRHEQEQKGGLEYAKLGQEQSQFDATLAQSKDNTAATRETNALTIQDRADQKQLDREAKVDAQNRERHPVQSNGETLYLNDKEIRDQNAKAQLEARGVEFDAKNIPSWSDGESKEQREQRRAKFVGRSPGSEADQQQGDSDSNDSKYMKAARSILANPNLSPAEKQARKLQLDAHHFGG